MEICTSVVSHFDITKIEFILYIVYNCVDNSALRNLF